MLCLSDFNLSVGSAAAITEELYTLDRLFGVRLCGLGMEHIPDRVCKELRALRILSVRSNNLTGLPLELGNLAFLEELSIMHNRITTLPSTVRSTRGCMAFRAMCVR